MRDDLRAFCAHAEVTLPGAAPGPLAGLTFAAKDLFDVAGFITGAGNPDWLKTHERGLRQNFYSSVLSMGRKSMELLNVTGYHRRPAHLVAEQKGFFADEGLEVKFHEATYAPEHNQGMAEGRWDLSLSSADTMIARTTTDGVDYLLFMQASLRGRGKPGRLGPVTAIIKPLGRTVRGPVNTHLAP